LYFIIEGLVAHKDSIRVIESTDEIGLTLTVTVHKDDMGRLIGRDGNTAKALRAIIRAYGMTTQTIITVKINEPN